MSVLILIRHNKDHGREADPEVTGPISSLVLIRHHKKIEGKQLQSSRKKFLTDYNPALGIPVVHICFCQDLLRPYTSFDPY